MKIRVVKLTMTCWACPSQWDAECVDGGYFYARYRWSVLQFGTGLTRGEAVKNALGCGSGYGQQINVTARASDGIDEGWAGEMDTSEMCELADVEIVA